MFKSKRHARAYLMGVYLSDGSVRTSSGKFRLDVTGIEFRDMTATAMEMVGAKFTLREFQPTPHRWGKKRVYGLGERAPYHVGRWLETWFPSGKDHLPFIPDNLARDMVAGILDGDGCIRKRSRRRGGYALTVCGLSRYLADLQILFASFGVKMFYRPGCKEHTINLESFVKARFYFRMPRKQALINAYIKRL